MEAGSAPVRVRPSGPLRGGVAWLIAALPPALLMDYMDLGWWLGHLFELLGIVIVGATVAVDLWRSAQSRSLVGDLRAARDAAFVARRRRRRLTT